MLFVADTCPQVGTAQVGTAQVGTAQVGTAQVGTATTITNQPLPIVTGKRYHVHS